MKQIILLLSENMLLYEYDNKFLLGCQDEDFEEDIYYYLYDNKEKIGDNNYYTHRFEFSDNKLYRIFKFNDPNNDNWSHLCLLLNEDRKVLYCYYNLEIGFDEDGDKEYETTFQKFIDITDEQCISEIDFKVSESPLSAQKQFPNSKV